MRTKFLFISILAVFTFAATAQKKTAPVRKPAAKPAPGSMAASMANGKKIYVKYCLSCHQADGGGVQNMNPALIHTSYVLGDKARIIKIVLNGFNDRVEINDQTYSNAMPPFAVLKDKEIADVLTYVRNHFTNKASAVKPGEVLALRGTVNK